MRFTFGDWTLDQGRRELLHGRTPVPLTPKALQLLELLLEHRPNAVAKASIHDRLWPSTFVSEVNLSRLVFELREALGDDSQRPRWIRTVRGFGYAFADTGDGDTGDDATPDAGLCRLILRDREVRLAEGENVLGRSHRSSVWLDSTSVSRRHARITVEGDRATLEDLKSKNGTFRAGRKVNAPVLLEDGDVLRVGSVQLTFRILPPERSTESVATVRD